MPWRVGPVSFPHLKKAPRSTVEDASEKLPRIPPWACLRSHPGEGDWGSAHLAHYRCHQGTAQPMRRQCCGTDSSGYLSHHSAVRALFSSSARILFILSNWHGFDLASCGLHCSDLWPCPELWSIGDKFERPCCHKAQFKCVLSGDRCRRQVKGLIDDLLTLFRCSGHFLPMSLMVTTPPPLLFTDELACQEHLTSLVRCPRFYFYRCYHLFSETVHIPAHCPG